MTPFVGRKRELGVLQNGLDQTLAGRGGLWLLVGPAGIGKTRLADELAAGARQRGVGVLWGRCWEGEGAPAFWPWVQLVRACIAHTPSVGATLAPEIRGLVSDLVETATDHVASPLDPIQARFRLFDAVTTFWSHAAAAPLLLILDDLHWADVPSLRLLGYLASELHQTRIMCVGTYREADAGDEPTRGALILDVARRGESLNLRGLTHDDVAALLTAALPAAPSPETVHRIAERSEGNPFFIGELVRLGDSFGERGTSGGVPLPVPQAIRNVVQQRVGRLPPSCREVLQLAAVIGRAFDLDTLAAAWRALGVAGGDTTTALDEAIEAGVVMPDTAPHRYRFAHALIRDTLYESTTTAARVRLHRCVGEGLAASHAADTRTAEIAHHFLAAAPADGWDRAVDYAIRAGDRAAALLAFEEAVRFYQLALAGMSSMTPVAAPVARHLELLLRLGDVQIRAGERPAARATYRAAAELARGRVDQRSFARAALGFAGLGDATATVDTPAVGLLEEALAGLGSERSPTRVRVMSRLAELLYFSDAAARRDALSHDAVSLAEELGDAGTLAYALIARHFALWAPHTLAERTTIAERILALTTGAAHKEMALFGRLWRVIDLLELGDIPAVDAELAQFAALAGDLRQAFHLWQAESMYAMRAMLDGRFADAERLIESAVALGRQAQSPMVTFRYGVQLSVLRREQDRLDEVEPFSRMMVERYPHLPVARAWLTLIYVRLGRLDEARAQLEHLAADEFGRLPLDATWLSTLSPLAVACGALGDTARAATLYRLLLPYAERNIVVSFAYGCDGAVARLLGLLATVLSRYDDAAGHFETALRLHQRMGARPLVAHTQREYADMLRRRGAPGDDARARDLAAAAATTFTALGLSRFAELTRAEPTPSTAPAPTAPSARAPAFVRQSDVWMIDYAGLVVRLRDAKGLHYLAHLLRHPGRDWHVLDLTLLVNRSSAEPVDLSRGALRHHLRSAPSGPDSRAKAAYGQRLSALRAELEDAETCNDSARGAAVQREIDLLTTEIGSAYRLGAARQPNEPLEKARKAVSNRLRSALTRLEREHPALAHHLAVTVRIGTYCSYRPEHPPGWRLD